MFEDKDFIMGVMCDFRPLDAFLPLLYLEEIFERRDEIIFYSPAHGDRPHWHALEHRELVFDYTILRKNAFVSDNSHERF